MGCSQSDSDSGLGSIVTPARFARRDALFVLAAATTSFLDLVSSFVFVPVEHRGRLLGCGCGCGWRQRRRSVQRSGGGCGCSKNPARVAEYLMRPPSIYQSKVLPWSLPCISLPLLRLVGHLVQESSSSPAVAENTCWSELGHYARYRRASIVHNSSTLKQD
jgi:hypothetical protein